MIYEVIVDISNSEVDKVFDYLSPFPVNIGDRGSLFLLGKDKSRVILLGKKRRALVLTI